MATAALTRAKAVDHHADQRPIAQARPTVDASMLSRSLRAWSAVSTGVLPRLTACFGPRTECAGIDREHLADDQPVEQHADRGQVLLDGRLLKILAERADIGGHMHRLDRRPARRGLVRSHQAKNPRRQA